MFSLQVWIKLTQFLRKLCHFLNFLNNFSQHIAAKKHSSFILVVLPKSINNFERSSGVLVRLVRRALNGPVTDNHDWFSSCDKKSLRFLKRMRDRFPDLLDSGSCSLNHFSNAVNCSCVNVNRGRACGRLESCTQAGGLKSKRIAWYWPPSLTAENRWLQLIPYHRQGSGTVSCSPS